MDIDERKINGYEAVLIATDRAAGYRGIIAIHNTQLGPALGGTRLWRYTDDIEALTDVLRLARGMTYKNAWQVCRSAAVNQLSFAPGEFQIGRNSFALMVGSWRHLGGPTSRQKMWQRRRLTWDSSLWKQSMWLAWQSALAIPRRSRPTEYFVP